MKTGMEWPLILLILLLAAVLGWSAWQGLQVDVAVTRLQAETIGISQPVVSISEWIVKVVVTALAGASVSAVIAGLMVWVRREWLRSEGTWKSGPYAKWRKQDQPGTPKPMSESELMRLIMMQQMGINKGSRANPVEDDNDPIIRL